MQGRLQVLKRVHQSFCETVENYFSNRTNLVWVYQVCHSLQNNVYWNVFLTWWVLITITWSWGHSDSCPMKYGWLDICMYWTIFVLPWIRALNVSIPLHTFIPLIFRFKDSLLESSSAWKEFYDSKNPHTQQLPDGWTHLGWVLLVLKQLFNWETILLSAQLQLSISYLGGRLRNIFANTKQAFSSHRLL